MTGPEFSLRTPVHQKNSGALVRQRVMANLISCPRRLIFGHDSRTSADLLGPSPWGEAIPAAQMPQDPAILVEAVKLDIEIVVRGTAGDRSPLAGPHLLA